MIDLTRIQAAVAGHDLVRAVDLVPRGHVRIETELRYPDGGCIDLFVVDDGPLVEPSRLSDLGQTTEWLLHVQVKPWLSSKRQQYLEDALRLYDVTQNGGALETRLPGYDHLVTGIVRLGQACIRVADLTYTRRSALVSSFSEAIEEILVDRELPYEPNVELAGRFGNLVRVDFVVRGPHRGSAILGLSSGSSSQAHVQANEIFRRWYDLDVPERTEQRVTVFDDRVDVYRDEDLARLRNLSDLVALSDRTTLTDVLAA